MITTDTQNTGSRDQLSLGNRVCSKTTQCVCESRLPLVRDRS